LSDAVQSRLDCVVRETQGLTAPSAASAPVTATATQLMPEAKTPGAISTLWKDSSLQGLEQLSNELTAIRWAYRVLLDRPRGHRRERVATAATARAG